MIRLIPLGFLVVLLFMASCQTKRSDFVYKIKVKDGDTLGSLAQRFESSEEHIRELNNLSKGANLKPGQVLYVEPRTSPTASRSGLLFGRSIRWPVKGRISSHYGRRGLFRHHDGIDIVAASGTPVRASSMGKVVFAGWKHGYGRTLIIRHQGFKTLYAHCQKILVEEGDSVLAGDKIALVGSSGRSSGPHLHFEYRTLAGTPLNPLDHLPL